MDRTKENGTTKQQRPAGFERARLRALEVAKDRSRTLRVVHEAVKYGRKNQGAVSRVGSDLFTMLRLLQAWATRDYRRVPWRAVTYTLAAVLYFLSPIDLIPDMLAGVGFVDDAAMLAFVARQVRKDLEDFRQWESRRKGKAMKA